MSDSLSRIDLLKDLVRIDEEIEETPTKTEVESRAKFPIEAFEDEFGSLKGAMDRVGFQPDNFQPGDSDDNLIDALQRVQNGQRITPYQFERETEFSRSDYREEYGSWRGFLYEADLLDIEIPETENEANKKYSNEELIKELWRLGEYTGPPSVRQMDGAGKYGSNTYMYRFGSWNNALEIAGFEPREPSVESEDRGRGSTKHYGRTAWQELRQNALERDGYECQQCGITEEAHKEETGVGLNVHHIEDVATFENPAEADYLENLETLCSSCHGSEHPFSSE